MIDIETTRLNSRYFVWISIFSQKANSKKMVGDPFFFLGIEPGVRLREGVTVLREVHTLRPVAQY